MLLQVGQVIYIEGNIVSQDADDDGQNDGKDIAHGLLLQINVHLFVMGSQLHDMTLVLH